MFIENIDHKKNNFFRYLRGLLIIIFFSFIGQIPLSLYIIYGKLNYEFLDTNNQFEILSLIPSNIALVLILFPFLILFPVIYLVVTKFHKQSFKSLITSRNKIDIKKIMFSFFLWGSISIGLISMDYLMNPDHYSLNFRLIPFVFLLIIGCLLIPIQTSVEELIFRGYLMQGIGILTKNRLAPLFITSIIFGLLHYWNPEVDKLGVSVMWYYIGTGFFLGIITLMDNGLELALGFHAANNLVTALIVTASWTSFQTESILID